MTDWRTVGALTDFEAGECCGVEVDMSDTERLQLVVVIDGEDQYVFLDRCPHRGAQFSTVGHVDAEDGVMVCGWHYWGFRLSDGGHTLLDGVGVPRYATRVVDGLLQVNVAREDPGE